MSKINTHNLKGCTIDNINDRLKRRLIDDGTVISVSLEFATLLTDAERIRYINGLFKKYDISVPYLPVSKNDTRSFEIRNKGNEQYKNKKYIPAIILYNESIACATTNSEFAALAYGNRSAVLFYLKQYSRCIEDIERAEKSGYPKDLLHKLTERRRQCEVYLNNKPVTTKHHAPAKKILQGPNSEIPCASAALSLHYTKNLGRHVIAKNDISAGDILALERPYCTSILHSMRYSRCSNCLGKSLCMVPCPRCSDAMFCDDNCMNEGMKRFHNIECAIRPSLITLDLTKIQILSFRVPVWALTSYGSDIGALKRAVREIEEQLEDERTIGFTQDSNGHMVYQSDTYAPIHCLVTNNEHRLPADLFYRSVVATGILHLVREYTEVGRGFSDEDAEFFGGLILRHLQTTACNMHSIEELSEKSDADCQLGNGAFAFHSLLNHSCSANITRTKVRLDGRWVMMTVAMRPIKAGEEIRDNYGYHYALMGRKERQEGLLQQYMFQCSCPACLDDYPLYWNLPLLPGVPKTIIPEADMKKLQSHDRKFAQEKLPHYMKQLNALASYDPQPNVQVCDLQESAKQCLAILGFEAWY